MQKQVIIALAVVSALTAGFFLFRNKPTTTPVETDALKNVYNQWKVDYKINVGAAEDDFRFKVFTNTYGEIQKHNTLLGRSFNMGLNQFSHLTREEFAATRLGLKVDNRVRNGSALALTGDQEVDWTGKMNPVKDQAQCGSCWAFSAVGALEGLHSISGEGKKVISEQELVDCSTKYGNNGCNGGLMDYAFQYVIDAKGIALESEYPYKGADQRCKTDKTTRNAVIKGFTDVKENSKDALIAALSKQPVSVAIQADSSIFQSYSSGVINSKKCGTELDHGVVAVGYNLASGNGQIPYYNVRNSWGPRWGDKGHVKIAIVDGEGICGIQKAASFPTL